MNPQTPNNNDPYNPTPPAPQPIPPTDVTPSDLPPALPMQPQQPWTSQPTVISKRSGKKWWLIGGIVAIVILLLGSAFAAYALYNKPENVLKDALYSTVSATSAGYTGKLSSHSDGSDIELSIDGQGDQTGQQINLNLTTNYLASTIKLGGDIITQKDAIYFRLTNVKDAVIALDTNTPGFSTLLQPLVKELDNQWIKLTNKDNPALPISTTPPTCIQNLITTIQTDKSEQAALQQLYQQHPFITIKKQFANEKINGSDSFHYQVVSNPQQDTEFSKGFNNLKSAKAYQKCSGSPLTSDSSTAETNAKTTIDIWADIWGHKLKRILLNSNDDTKTKLDLTFDLGKAATIKAPANTKSIDTITKDLNAASSSLFSPNITLTN